MKEIAAKAEQYIAQAPEIQTALDAIKAEIAKAGGNIDSSGSRRTAMNRPERERRADDFLRHIPVHVVWEITLACDLKCLHCGSRAGAKRAARAHHGGVSRRGERPSRLEAREVTLIGGEAYLRSDWIEIVRAVREHGMRCTMQTGGRNLTEARLSAAVRAGLQGIGVSIDGLAPLHDELRGVAGSFDKAIEAVRSARSLGIPAGVNTQIGARRCPTCPR